MTTLGEFLEFDLELYTLFLLVDFRELPIDLKDYLGEKTFPF